jgi:hypothetical protein
MRKCFRFATSFEVERMVNAPADIVWETRMDIDAIPAIVSVVKSIERIKDYDDDDDEDPTITNNNMKPIGVGTRWKETREYSGARIVVHQSITDVSTEVDDNIKGGLGECRRRTVRYGSYVDNAPWYWFAGNAAATRTVTVVPITDASCHVSVTWAIVSDHGWVAGVRSVFCGCFTVAKTKRHFHNESLAQAVEAERRYRDKLRQPRQGEEVLVSFGG